MDISLGSTSAFAMNGLEIIGTIAFSISGAIAANRKGMDWFGAVVLGTIVAVGGGTLRDVVLGNTPVFWIRSPWYMILASVCALIMIPLSRKKMTNRRNYLLIADAAGLGVFVVNGTYIATQQYGIGSFAAVILGVGTGIAGGIIRDLLINEVPAVFKGEVYAAAGIAGSVLFLLLSQYDINDMIRFWVPIVLIFTLRLFAIYRQWSFPTAPQNDQ
jgi:uncharacterized membrane protein YeiH